MSAFCSANGIDTVRFRWRGDHELWRQFQRRSEGTIEGQRGERYTQTEYGRLGAYPDGLVYLEGRAAALEKRDKSDHSLASVTQLFSAERVARSVAIHNGIPLQGEEARLGRVDLAAELRFSDATEGGAFLHSLASLDVPWCKSRVDGRKGNHIETVSFHGTRGKTIYLRAYDKGVESGTSSAGLRIRVERQKRFRKDREPDVLMFSETDLRQAYIGREFSQLVDLPYATVCDVPEALSVLCEYDIPASQAERLAGFLVVGGHLDYSRPSWYRRHSELRQLGIFVDPTQIERLEVPVGRYLQALASSWSEAA